MTDRIIAIGDVHGCAKALATLIEAIHPTGSDTLAFLGDYIDRGPDSRGVVEQVIALGKRCTVVPLLGNHDALVPKTGSGAPGSTALTDQNEGCLVRPPDTRYNQPDQAGDEPYARMYAKQNWAGGMQECDDASA